MKKGDAKIAILFLYLYENDFFLNKLKLSHFSVGLGKYFIYTKDDNNTKKKKIMAHKHTSGLLRSLFEYLLLNNVIELPAWDMYGKERFLRAARKMLTISPLCVF